IVKNGTRSGRARFRCAKGRDYKPQAKPETHESKRRKTSTQYPGAQTQTSAEDRIEDCIMVAATSVKANFKVTSTKLGLQRLRQVGTDSYEPGTAAPRASERFIDGLDALNPDVEDEHDRALTATKAAAREDHEDAVALGINQPPADAAEL
ncbi:hypothetical protein N658DRAFT_435671, partial [Parathielavia hyrcaniae]